MRSVIESKVKTGLQRLGINISYATNDDNNPEMYMNSLKGAISVKKPFNIIQVGANDGKHNDPIYDFVKNHKNSTSILLIEPIKSVIPYLEENYSYHPSSEIINKAIGDQDSSSIELYAINQDYWDNINTGYGEDWPDYRIPTGVTTTNRDQLVEWISKNVQSDAAPKTIIEKFHLETVQPDTIIDQSQNMNDVQLLQVDTEGLDDKIVYSFLESNIRPNIINIESKHLTQARRKRYNRKMRAEGYDVYSYTPSETLALK